MHFFAGVAVAIGAGLAPWIAAKVPTRWIVMAAALFLVILIAGLVFGLAIYPFSSVFVAAFGILVGIALGRAMPPRFRPFVVLLLVLSILDVAQNFAFAGPSSSSTTSATPDPHFIWLNVRFPLPGGHFNIGFADVILIAAAAENLRRRGATLALSVLPGVIAIGLGEALLSTLTPNPPTIVVAISTSLVLFLTAGYVLTELAVSQTATKTA
ncbi:MAG TPA: hypothetical protein VFR33_03635 [Candidatus Dormibacteraeota bacterium]|nr:hypothetical protein [Candidatus Dormibacteraeota bacterium]